MKSLSSYKTEKRLNKKNEKTFNFQLSTFNSRQRRGGFSLIEMLVALSLFTIVVTVALGSLLTIIDANKKSQAMQSLMTNLNFVMDDISRNARVGSTYNCNNANSSLNNIDSPKNCSSGKTRFAFEPTGGDPSNPLDQIVYRVINSTVEKSTNGGGDYTQITSPNITIEYMEFHVFGAPSGDGSQPRVIIVMRGIAGIKDKIKTNFSIQTTVTQRVLDI